MLHSWPYPIPWKGRGFRTWFAKIQKRTCETTGW